MIKEVSLGNINGFILFLHAKNMLMSPVHLVKICVISPVLSGKDVLFGSLCYALNKSDHYYIRNLILLLAK